MGFLWIYASLLRHHTKNANKRVGSVAGEVTVHCLSLVTSCCIRLQLQGTHVVHPTSTARRRFFFPNVLGLLTASAHYLGPSIIMSNNGWEHSPLMNAPGSVVRKVKSIWSGFIGLSRPHRLPNSSKCIFALDFAARDNVLEVAVGLMYVATYLARQRHLA
jgi:hypothetical protein